MVPIKPNRADYKSFLNTSTSSQPILLSTATITEKNKSLREQNTRNEDTFNKNIIKQKI
jgi:hypothetical protein